MKFISLEPLKTRVNKVITVPGSKSLTNRAILLASLTKGKVVIKNALIADDTLALVSCLRELGVKIIKERNTIYVRGDVLKMKSKKSILHANLSGTTIRFLAALCCILPGEKILTGNEGLLKRPIKDLVDGLEQLGAKIEYVERNGHAPLRIIGSKLKPQTVHLNGNISSQFLSAILMIAPKIGNVEIGLTTKLISTPYVSMTMDIMKQFGVEVINENFKKFIVKKQNYDAREIIIEGDYSSASYFAAIAALTKSKIKLKNLSANSLQADKEFFRILEKMGNKITSEKDSVTVVGKGIKSISTVMENCPDQIQTLAILASFAKGKTEISGISSLRVKETDRIFALQTELEKMGIKTDVKNNTLIIFGGNPHAATIETYNDHRMALAFAVAGSVLNGMKIKNPSVVNKTFPSFFYELKKVGVTIIPEETTKEKIILIGFGGAGKTSVAPLLAKKLKKNVLEMDDLVIKKSGKRSVKEIFEKNGEEHFRKLELNVSKSLKNKKGVVISTGGGVIMNKFLMTNLKNKGTTVLLKTTFNTVVDRVSDISTRPLWKNKKSLKKLFDIRQSLYAQYADVIVETDGKSLGMVTDEIVKKLENL